MGNVRQPKTDGKVTTLTPAVEGGKKLGTLKSKAGGKSEKRSLEEPEVGVFVKIKGLVKMNFSLLTLTVYVRPWYIYH